MSRPPRCLSHASSWITKPGSAGAGSGGGGGGGGMTGVGAGAGAGGGSGTGGSTAPSEQANRAMSAAQVILLIAKQSVTGAPGVFGMGAGSCHDRAGKRKAPPIRRALGSYPSTFEPAVVFSGRPDSGPAHRDATELNGGQLGLQAGSPRTPCRVGWGRIVGEEGLHERELSVAGEKVTGMAAKKVTHRSFP